MKFFVNAKATTGGNGTEEKPFSKINEAARLAKPGDEVLVYPGVYREWVDPVVGGEEGARITYTSVEKGKAIITGAEPVNCWQATDKTGVWVCRVANKIFGDFNPFTEWIFGDWFVANQCKAHRGEVYLNDKSMYEVFSLEEVENPVKSKVSWDPEFSVYTWFVEQDEAKDETVIYANFQGKNPNEEKVEISVRKACFYPSKEGCGYITLSGFTVCKAATQWAPPTAYQEGMIGPHWSKGWIIEDCEIFESKCCGISLGKYLQPSNDNKWLKWKYKDGTQTERENICLAQLEGWSKEKIGSHIVRNCHIHDCGQTGIVGHLGGVFSLIENCHIHHICNKLNLAGAETGGIKLHAAIDTVIRNNCIHDCVRGVWLDWQAQGTRVSNNLFFNNVVPKATEYTNEMMFGMGEDLQVEVSHGPTLVDNNIFLSDYAVKIASQGVALVHNLIAGGFTSVGIAVSNGTATLPSPRYTPYHVPHETGIAGFMTILHGDCRFYNNIFLQQDNREFLKVVQKFMKGTNDWMDGNIDVGTHPYEDYPDFEEFKAKFEGYCGMGAPESDKYYEKLPVWAAGNVYLNGAVPMTREKDAQTKDGFKAEVKVEEKDGRFILVSNLDELTDNLAKELIGTETLGMAFEPEQRFENPDGSDIVFDVDFLGNKREDKAVAGPFETYDKEMILFK